MNKYVGNVVEIIYMDRKGRITHRKIEVLAVKDGRIRAKMLAEWGTEIVPGGEYLGRAAGGRKSLCFLTGNGSCSGS
ncbi:hypothetical protein [Paenibacillus sp. 7541]|uniref:hypothetical protein n=1 Tax=Paenibacillus sp. 7541 TaxID=2026236 RepID=UPI0020D18705|nr:hypothetical protein [Paenibacillus sp. 7541]